MKVLLLHNSSCHRTILRTLLESWGFEVVLAADGYEAQAILDSESAPRLALLDAAMPGLSGFELCEKIRAQQKVYIYVVILSADDRLSLVCRSYECGADDFICDPFDGLKLKLRLQVAERILNTQQVLLEAREALKFEASHDALVKLWNRKAILNLLAIELSRAKRMHASLSVFFADLDHFKSINDAHGHLIGDEVLRAAASRMSHELREYDHLGRYGGEEFLAVLPSCAADAARDVAERVRRSLAERPILVDPAQITVTVSIGVAEWRPGQELPELLERADIALYNAKNGGRNRVEVEDGRQALHIAASGGHAAEAGGQLPAADSSEGKIWARARRMRRYAIDRKLEIVTLDQGTPELLQGRIRDISENGLGAVIARALQVDEEVTLHFHLENGQEYTVAATVRHCTGGYVGFEFIVLDSNLRDAITKVCREGPGPGRRRKTESGGG